MTAAQPAGNSERWQPVPGWQGFYEVSDAARVRSLPRAHCIGQIIRPRTDTSGTVYVSLSRDGRQKVIALKMLVAQAFLGPVPPGMRVRQRSGDKSDCRAANLAWEPGPPVPDARSVLAHRTRTDAPWRRDRKRAAWSLPPAILGAHLSYMRQEGLSEATIYTRKRHLIRLGRALPVPVLKAEARHLRAWREKLAITPDAVLTAVSNVRTFYGWALDQGLIESNPAAKLPVPRYSSRLPRPMSEKDLMTALEHAPQPIRLMLVLTNWCGLRCKEVALLRRENIMETAAAPVLVIAGDATKGRRPHVIPLSDFAVAEIQAAALPLSGYAFKRADGKPGPNAPHRISKLINDHLHGLGLAATTHMGRHRFATQVYRASRDLLMLRDVLGHADISSTQVYALFDQQSAVDAVAALPVPPRPGDRKE